MKKALLYSILALSINVFAQSKQPLRQMRHQPINTTENPQSMIPDGKWKVSELYTKMNSGQTKNRQRSLETSMIQIVDSTYSGLSVSDGLYL